MEHPINKLRLVLEPGDNRNAVTHIFRLYIAGESVNSNLAFSNLKAFCETCYPGNYHIERVDVLLSPEIAWAEGITVTPMLLRLSPKPNIKIMGNLKDTQQLTDGLSAING